MIPKWPQGAGSQGSGGWIQQHLQLNVSLHASIMPWLLAAADCRYPPASPLQGLPPRTTIDSSSPARGGHCSGLSAVTAMVIKHAPQHWWDMQVVALHGSQSTLAQRRRQCNLSSVANMPDGNVVVRSGLSCSTPQRKLKPTPL